MPKNKPVTTKPKIAKSKTPRSSTYIPTSIHEIDRVLGGGLVPGRTLLVGGPSGAGMTTLLLQMAEGFAKEGRKALFASGEMTGQAIEDYRRRIGALGDGVLVHHDSAGLDVDKVITKAQSLVAGLLVIDSIHVALFEDVTQDVGSSAQMTASMNTLSSFAQAKGICVLVANHFNDKGSFSGPMAIQHTADGLLRVEQFVDEEGLETSIREISMDKSRQSRIGIRAHLEITGGGFRPLSLASMKRLRDERYHGTMAMSEPEPLVHIPTGIPELDKVLGGGLVPGKLVVLKSERGAGKTTLGLQAANGFARDGRKALFASGEMDGNANVDYAKRLNIANADVSFFCNPQGIDVEDLFDRALTFGARLVIVDSAQLCMVSDVHADIATKAMLEAAVNMLASFANVKKRAILLVWHDVKSVDLSAKVEHLVDAVVNMTVLRDGYGKDMRLRELSLDGKSRQGYTDAKTVIEITDRGFVTRWPSALTGPWRARGSTDFRSIPRRSPSKSVSAVKPGFFCDGVNHKRGGKPACCFQAAAAWRGPCPGCGGNFSCLRITKGKPPAAPAAPAKPKAPRPKPAPASASRKLASPASPK